MYYLLHYNRPTGMLVRLDTFTELASATQEVLALEIALLGERNGDEVVLLHADDEAALRRTHGRYFTNFKDLRLPFRLARKDWTRPVACP